VCTAAGAKKDHVGEALHGDQVAGQRLADGRGTEVQAVVTRPGELPQALVGAGVEAVGVAVEDDPARRAVLGMLGEVVLDRDPVGLPAGRMSADEDDRRVAVQPVAQVLLAADVGDGCVGRERHAGRLALHEDDPPGRLAARPPDELQPAVDADVVLGLVPQMAEVGGPRGDERDALALDLFGLRCLLAHALARDEAGRRPYRRPRTEPSWRSEQRLRRDQSW
jgi:hypothetical protein